MCFSVKRSYYDVNVQEDINTLNYFIKDCSKFLQENNIVLVADKQSIFGISEFKYLSRFSLMTSISRFPERNFSKLEVGFPISVLKIISQKSWISHLIKIIYVQLSINLSRINQVSCSSSPTNWMTSGRRFEIVPKAWCFDKINIGSL